MKPREKNNFKEYYITLYFIIWYKNIAYNIYRASQNT